MEHTHNLCSTCVCQKGKGTFEIWVKCTLVLPQVQSPRGAAEIHVLQLTHRPVGRWLHHGWAVHPQTPVPRIQWNRHHLQNLSSPGNTQEGTRFYCLPFEMFKCTVKVILHLNVRPSSHWVAFVTRTSLYCCQIKRFSSYKGHSVLTTIYLLTHPFIQQWLVYR